MYPGDEVLEFVARGCCHPVTQSVRSEWEGGLNQAGDRLNPVVFSLEAQAEDLSLSLSLMLRERVAASRDLTPGGLSRLVHADPPWNSAYLSQPYVVCTHGEAVVSFFMLQLLPLIVRGSHSYPCRVKSPTPSSMQFGA